MVPHHQIQAYLEALTFTGQKKKSMQMPLHPLMSPHPIF